MESREELLKNIEKQIDDCWDSIREEYFVLGEKLYKLSSTLSLPVGKNLLEGVIAVDARRNETGEKYNQEAALIEEFSKKSEENESVQRSLEGIIQRERKEKICLGAIIYERASLSLLDRKSFDFVYKDIDKELDYRKKENSRNPIERLSAQNSLSKLKKSANERYVSYSDIAIEKGLLDSIGGSNAPNIIASLESIAKEKQEAEDKSSSLLEYIDSNKAIFQKLKKSGLEETKAYKEDVDNQYRENLISYGNYLFDKGGVWVDEKTPSDVLDTIEDILKLQKDFASLNEDKQRLHRDSKVDDYRALIQEEEAKILILEKEKEKIDQEIEQIRIEIRKLNSMIERL